LSAKITGKDTTNNDFLKFPNSLPTIDDIRWAITQGGNNGSTFSDAEILQWADIVISNIADGGNGTGTATISAKPDADNYHNLNYDQTKTVTISFTYPN
jgi:hypothetical protein